MSRNDQRGGKAQHVPLHAIDDKSALQAGLHHRNTLPPEFQSQEQSAAADFLDPVMPALAVFANRP